MAGLFIEHKRDFHWRLWLLVLLGVILLSVSGWLAYRWFTTGEQPPLIPLPASALADPSIDEEPIPQSAVDNHKVSATHPRYISIPALNIKKVRVKDVGLTANNLLDTPANIHDTAWYRDGAFPGQGYGAVIINGHNGGVTRDGVFAGLANLKNGDEIIIERGDGRKITYRVVENRTESLTETNKTGMKRLMTPYDQSKEGLGLITCAGKWVPRDKVFDKRILVRAVVVEEETDTDKTEEASDPAELDEV
jgi:LPXTG-site transpeptidase (sortase) family protein